MSLGGEENKRDFAKSSTDSLKDLLMFGTSDTPPPKDLETEKESAKMSASERQQEQDRDINRQRDTAQDKKSQLDQEEQHQDLDREEGQQQSKQVYGDVGSSAEKKS